MTLQMSMKNGLKIPNVESFVKHCAGGCLLSIYENSNGEETLLVSVNGLEFVANGQAARLKTPVYSVVLNSGTASTFRIEFTGSSVHFDGGVCSPQDRRDGEMIMLSTDVRKGEVFCIEQLGFSFPTP